MIDWKNAPEWAKYAAMDSNHVWHWFEQIPTEGHSIWYLPPYFARQVFEHEKVDEWKASLQKLPTHDACKDHKWISADNEHVKCMEMCLTCYEAGETRIPVRKAELNIEYKYTPSDRPIDIDIPCPQEMKNLSERLDEFNERLDRVLKGDFK